MQYYLESEDAVLRSLKTSPDGLSETEAAKRIAKYGQNRLTDRKKEGIIKKFFKSLADPMIIMLLAAAIVSTVIAVIQNEPFTDLFIILFVVAVNTVLGVFQESKAEHAIEALKEMVSASANVIRDGTVKSVKSENLTVGDIIIIEAGDQIPADCRIIESHSLKTDEAPLTGESFPIAKMSDILYLKKSESTVPLGDRLNMLYSGSTVVYGRGKAVVTAVGMSTEMGKIAGALNDSISEMTPLQKKMSELSGVLTKLVIGICLAVFIFGIIRAGYFSGKVVLDTFMMSIALAVAAIPEGLPAVVTIILSAGVTSMSKKNALIRRLSAVETLGATQIICSDKTGTLTQNKMTVTDTYTNDKDLLITAFALCCDAKPNDPESNAASPIERTQKITGEPTECALIGFAIENGLDLHALCDKHKRVFEIPFDSERKLMTTVSAYGSGYVQFTKGACEVLLERCTHYIDKSGKISPLTSDIKTQINNVIGGFAAKALRVLGVGFKKHTAVPQNGNIENNLIFIGLCGMIDPCRPEAYSAIAECREAGIRPIMITGDHKDTAVAIAKELKIIENSSEAVTGSELQKMSESELAETVGKCSVFARVQPEHKTGIVKALKNLGYVVAMTGDGINDAPSIKSADIGISMGITGTDVTKGISDMVLADDNFATIVSSVEEGRRIYDTVRKVIQFQLSTNMAEVVVIFVSSFLGVQILSPAHLLWINMVTDSAPGLALGMEKSESDIMKRTPRKSNESIFSGNAGSDMIIQGIFMSLLIFLSYFLGQYFEFGKIGLFASAVGASMAFLTTNFVEIFHAVCMRSQREYILKLKTKNPWLIGSFVLTAILTVGVMYIDVFSEMFKFQELGLIQLIISFIIAFLIVPFVELTKLIQKLTK